MRNDNSSAQHGTRAAPNNGLNLKPHNLINGIEKWPTAERHAVLHDAHSIHGPGSTTNPTQRRSASPTCPAAPCCACRRWAVAARAMLVLVRGVPQQQSGAHSLDDAARRDSRRTALAWCPRAAQLVVHGAPRRSTAAPPSAKWRSERNSRNHKPSTALPLHK